jgi:hypothetical protein
MNKTFGLGRQIICIAGGWSGDDVNARRSIA